MTVPLCGKEEHTQLLTVPGQGLLSGWDPNLKDSSLIAEIIGRGNDTDTISVFSFGHLSCFLSTSGMLSLCLVAMEQFSRQSCVISMLVKPTTQAMSGVGESGPAQTVITLFTGSLELAATDGYCLTLGCKVIRVERKTITTGDSEEGCT